jgi:hypothetical protein
MISVNPGNFPVENVCFSFFLLAMYWTNPKPLTVNGNWKNMICSAEGRKLEFRRCQPGNANELPIRK